MKFITPVLIILIVFWGAFFSAGTVIAHMAHGIIIVISGITALVYKKFNKKSFY
jgi:hypothetical protein